MIALMIALAIIAMVPRQVWIALGITVVVAFGLYLFVKWQAQKKPLAPIVREPTLAELTGLKSAPSKPRSSTAPAPASANQKILSSMLEAAQPPTAPSPSQSIWVVSEPIGALNRSVPPDQQVAPPQNPALAANDRPGNLRTAMEHIVEHGPTTPVAPPTHATPGQAETSPIILSGTRAALEPSATGNSQDRPVSRQPNGNLLEAMRAVAEQPSISRQANSAIDAASDAPRIIVPTPSRPRSTASPSPSDFGTTTPDAHSIAPSPPEAPSSPPQPNSNLLEVMRAVAAKASMPGPAQAFADANLEDQGAIALIANQPSPSAERIEAIQTLTPAVPPTPAPALQREAHGPSTPPPLPEASRTEAPRTMDELHRTSIAGSAPAKEFSVPKPPAGWEKTRWVQPGEIIEIRGVKISGGLFYSGVKLATPRGGNEPSLVNGVLAVAPTGNYREPVGYQENYADLSATERRAYINWLASDRSDPECNYRYVMLFLYGIERRVLIDGVDEPDSKQGWPAIKAALRHLEAAYGKIYTVIRFQINSLLDWMELDDVGEKLYTKPLPRFQRTHELPFYLRLALGQCSLDRAPIPAQLALAWARLSPEIPLRTATTRCAEEFDQLFLERYRELFDAGLVLPKNRTKLKFSRQTFSPAFYGTSFKPKTFGETPDVTALTGPIKKLNEIVQQFTDELGPLSRLINKNPEARNTLDGLLHLPTSIWPAPRKAALQLLVDEVKGRAITLPLTQLTDRFGNGGAPLNREKIRDLARTLEAAHIGMEPNVLEGARAPGDADPVVLFALLPGQTHQAQSSAYQIALLTLQLASTVAQADGDFSAHEIEHLGREIDAWSHLSPADHKRLRAHLAWLSQAPITLASLKKKLDPLDQSTKEAIAASMASLAQSDGTVSPDEMRFLEKVYKTLGVETKRVFSDVHAVSAGRSTTKVEPAKQFSLDPKRIAELQHDTAKVSALLAGIFTEDVAEPVIKPQTPILPSQEPAATPGMLGLDEAHSALLRLMLSRPNWTRSELEDSASDLELMLDGALEHINDASFDAYDIPFSEGDDPVEINPEFIEKIEQ
ncbi:putative tellurite resistance protein B-like protein [Xanthomonas arboricola]|uniref:tellurite resistance TerB family protein n=1 Tax=Xanthomonas euroxanthea TaxID=2259622 RepID=UPI002DD675D8|nr:TerB N-terminal domain-containing protein [Xanthomonas euroxanthea]NIK38876.1 putative tellurite resistance protein B-like protein [Xanthomonas euroxanthea]